MVACNDDDHHDVPFLVCSSGETPSETPYQNLFRFLLTGRGKTDVLWLSKKGGEASTGHLVRTYALFSVKGSA